MLQQTRVETVIPYFSRFLEAFPTVRDLAEADEQSVLKSWEGLGYYARARNLRKAAIHVMERHGGRIPEHWDGLRALPGVGDYIAAAVASIALSHPRAVVDGNVKRVLARFFRIGAPVNRPDSHAAFREAADRVLDRSDPGAFNQAVMELGQRVCLVRRPDCPACPLAAHCMARIAGETDVYPVREKRPRPPEVAVAAGVILRADGRMLVIRRPSKGLLGGLWEFPGGKLLDGEPPEMACRREIQEECGLDVDVGERLARVRHAYTHFRIVMDVFLCHPGPHGGEPRGPEAHRWISLDEFGSLPFPKATLKVLPALREWFVERPSEVAPG